MTSASGTVIVFLVTLVCVSQAVDIDGAWSDWSVIRTPCTKSCNRGSSTRVRSCTNPRPSGSGILCTKMDGRLALNGIDYKLEPCNDQSCWIDQWTDWSNCSKVCGRGKEVRRAWCGVEVCAEDQALEETRDCNTWNKTECDSPCEELKQSCPQYGICDDLSTDEDPIAECVCTMGYKMNSAKTACIRPPPTTPTPRPIPTLPPAQKVVATVISKTASTVIIICVSICLCIFFVLRIFTPDRVIQMNMEIALLMAHIMLIFPSSITEQPTLCTLVSILVHFFFTACFMFMFLEALHMYAFVAYVIKKEGMFSRVQNTLVGWGIAAIIILFCMCFEYENYGGSYHCWLQMDTALMYGQLLPIVSLVILTFTLIEAAGAAEYKPLKGVDKSQLTSAKFSQRTNLLILPLVFSHMLVGMFSEYEQNLPLYGVFSILNSVTGVVVLFFHCTNNQQVRMKLKGLYAKMCKSSGAR
ncbi:adhesion G-protein coupled receptor D1-like [Homarus americanus]|uniref:Adhesion G-protein coupled receptor D1-like n=1 Tax=Homarus americanus TaxID=6706 RepID=A0A8J5J844_HOMAM|nr:adhesion G-protein coupled receptor D1-like [Homarus americanus]XP_042208474.1 adhesion G-protein coupled receptor D1-like [Homarus americanus]KAG7154006.1 Adhesion G-protein coupled receptor D1-like [Homarus americanus]